MSKESRGTGHSPGRSRLPAVLTGTLCGIAIVLAIAVAGCGGSSHHHSQTHHFSFSFEGGLWVANGTNVLEFTSPVTSRTPNIAPSVVLTNSTGFFSTQGVVFDSSNDLWVIDGGNLAGTSTGDAFPALDEFTADQLTTGGTLNLTPAVSISGAATTLGFPQQAVFDSTGNMWVTDNSAGDVDVFTPGQLAVGGNIPPFASLTGTSDGNVFSGPLGIVFDSSGDLWVANNGTGNTIFEFDASTVATVLTGGPHSAAPDVVLSSANSSIEGPWALIFSANGDLVSSNANPPSTVVAFSAADLDTSGSPVPVITLSPKTVKGVPSLNSPNGIAFDTVEDLAVANSVAPFSVAIYEVSQLVAGGAIQPEVLISGSSTLLAAPAGDAFGPQH